MLILLIFSLVNISITGADPWSGPRKLLARSLPPPACFRGRRSWFCRSSCAFQPPSSRLPAAFQRSSGCLPAPFLRPSGPLPFRLPLLLPFRLPLLLPEAWLPASGRRSTPVSAPRRQIIVPVRLRASFRRTSAYLPGLFGRVSRKGSRRLPSFFCRPLPGVPTLVSSASGHFQRRFRPVCAELRA